MPQCVGRLCGEKYQYAPDTVFRYTEKQCKRACIEGSNLCKICETHEEANMAGKHYRESHWQGRMGGRIPPASHVEGSEWNIQLRLKEAAKAAKTLGAVNEVEKAEKNAAVALKVAAAEERKAATALRKEDAARKRASQAVAKAEKALLRKTKKNTQKVKSKSRKSSSSIIYRPASASSSNANARSNMSGQWVQPVRRATPISSNRQEPNPNTLQGIAANLAGLPELE